MANGDNNTKPLRFDLPDGDQVDLITWPYVLNRIQEAIETITATLAVENTSLQAIDDKLVSWIEEDET